jgi:hypothetical protein
MCRAIEQAYRIDEVKDIRDKAMALEAYARQAKNVEAERHASGIRLRAERKAGQLLKTMAKAKQRETGGKPKRSHRATVKKLADLGVSKTQSSRWQHLADVPEEKFEQALADRTEKPSTGAILRENAAEPESEAKTVEPEVLWLLDRLRDLERKYVKRDPIELLGTAPHEMRDEVRRIAPVVAGWLNRLSEIAGFDNIIEPAAGVGQLVGNEKETGTVDCSPDGKQVGIANTIAVCRAVAARDPWEAVGPIPEHLRRSAPKRDLKATRSAHDRARNERSEG